MVLITQYKSLAAFLLPLDLRHIRMTVPLLYSQHHLALVHLPLPILRHQLLPQHLKSLPNLTACLSANFLEKTHIIVLHEFL